MGRDLLARLLYGGRTSLLVGFAAAGLGVVLGVPLGLLAGYKGGKWEYWIMRACDTFQSFPSIILVLAIVNLVGASVWNIILVIGGLGWASVARLVYSGTLSTKKAEYVEASRALGAGGDGAAPVGGAARPGRAGPGTSRRPRRDGARRPGRSAVGGGPAGGEGN